MPILEKVMYEYELTKYAGDILESENFQKIKGHIQHGNMSVYEHCISVAKTSLYIKDKFNIDCNIRDLVRGALLHDYFLYDWHKNDKANLHPRLHGFYHPGYALKNAKREYIVNERQADIISKHMWPLTVIPPTCREAWIVTMADKYCSALETLHLHKGMKSSTL
jgi:uncharacterized protein